LIGGRQTRQLILGSAVTKSMVDVNLGVLGRKELDPDKAMDVGGLSTPPPYCPNHELRGGNFEVRSGHA
jgi:hypothetical protein